MLTGYLQDSVQTESADKIKHLLLAGKVPLLCLTRVYFGVLHDAQAITSQSVVACTVAVLSPPCFSRAISPRASRQHVITAWLGSQLVPEDAFGILIHTIMTYEPHATSCLSKVQAER